MLLTINCGLGNRDCAKLESKHINFAKGWLDDPRPKTGVKRRAKLWPETVETLKLVLDDRKTPKKTQRGDDYGSAASEPGNVGRPTCFRARFFQTLGCQTLGRLPRANPPKPLKTFTHSLSPSLY